ncbi:hypothetical protein GCM10025876_01660 [Demequina litorisediminis]|uniref:Phospholipid/glycerol acyltransferase domain-containing protein n=1 Tax=Demequina litorisediminis TaxID=1849022 RepID=A0ABQ6I9T8_9MICO|nr:hypothetical protein GCM10025876_01660 [Demequina litorisediminis]
MYYGLFKHVLIGPPVKTYYRPWSEGTENVPATGGAILASNHLSFSDSIFLPLVLKRKVLFLGKAEYFTGKGVKGWATKAFMEGSGVIPVHRGEAARPRLRYGRVLRRSRPESCWGSTPKERAAPTDACTAARPVWRAWPLRRLCPSSLSP